MRRLGCVLFALVTLQGGCSLLIGDFKEDQQPVFCGNGTREGDEECDGDDIGESTCGEVNPAYPEGELTCSNDCKVSSDHCFNSDDGQCDVDRGETHQNSVDCHFGEVVAGERYPCGVREAGSVWCWGSNELGQLGIGQQSQQTFNTPQRVATSVPLQELVAGANYTCVRTEINDNFCWGDNRVYQIRGALTDLVETPQRVSQIHAGEWPIAPGGEHSCGPGAEAGEIQCWGRDEEGQLGDGDLWEPGGGHPRGLLKGTRTCRA